MNTLLLILLIMTEAAFCFVTVSRGSDKGEYKLGRLIANVGELVLFLLTVLLPGIDLSFRFTMLITLLVIRAAAAGIMMLFRKKDRDEKKAFSKIMSAIGSALLFASALIPSYLFSDYNGLPVSGKYTVAQTKAIVIDENRTEEYKNDGSKREVPLYFYYPQDAAAGESFPVVFFSHGAFGYYQSNSSTYMELASNGYIVISMEHPYHSIFTHDHDGDLILADRSFMQDIGELYSDDTTIERADEIQNKMISLRLADANFAVDAIKDPSSAVWVYDNNEDTIASVLSMADTGRMGFMGHSLGGAAAVSIGRQRDDIDAVVDIDGTMLGETSGNEYFTVNGGRYMIAVNEDPEKYTLPLLSFSNQQSHDDDMYCRENNIPYVNNTVIDNAEQAYETYIAGTGHMNYTDLPLFSPFLANYIGSMTVSDDTAGTGTVDAEGCIVKMNEIILDFFDAYLKGDGEFRVEEGYTV